MFLVMKKALFLLTAVLISLSANAVEIIDGSIPSLLGETKINLKLDYSGVMIDNKTVDEWLEYRQADQPIYDAKEELEKGIKVAVQEKIVKAINNKLREKRVYVTTNGSARYTILVCPLSISQKGKNSNFCFIQDEKGNVLVSFTVNGKGGKWGSMVNLVGDGYGESGNDIASLVAECFK